MTTKKKTFDCVEFKRKAQEGIQAEWEARSEDFTSYEEFLRASINESEWGRRTWARIAGDRIEAG